MKPTMKKALLITAAFICVLLMAGLSACGDSADQESEQNTEATAAEESMDSMTPEQMVEKMIGAWVPTEGFEDVYYFGYMSDNGLSGDPSGILAVQADYVQGDGGGLTTVKYSYENGKLTYTEYVSEYSAGGSVGVNGVLEVENLQGDTAVINGAAYEKVSDDPADPDELAINAMDARIVPLISGKWETSDGDICITLNKDKTMNYKDAGTDIDGTWQTWGNMVIAVDFTGPDDDDEGSDYYWYDLDEDCLYSESGDAETLYRK